SSEEDVVSVVLVATFPFLRDLNPQIDNLPAILRIIKQHEGDNKAIADAIKELLDKTGKRKNYSRHSINANMMASMRESNLGVMTPDARLTEHGQALLKVIDDENAFKSLVARHLIVEKGGLAFCRALETVSVRRRKEIAEFLDAKYKVDFWRDHNNISSMH